MLLSSHEIDRLESSVANAFYCLDLDRVEENLRQIESLFTALYAETKIAYSYKTNYAPAICRQVRDLGADAEVVSEMEYEMALQVGHRGEEIIVNGPLHSRDFLERALLAGSRVNLDSWYMLDHLDAICHSHPQQEISIGVRLNYDIVEGGASRFGFVVNDATMARLH
ncbi:MAG: pyridoxal-dependent decarboxylase, partial [Acidobacteriota bacterium]